MPWWPSAQAISRLRALRGALTRVGWVRGSGCMLFALLGDPGVRGERFVDEPLGDGRVLRTERCVAPVRRCREPRANRRIDEMVRRASPAAAGLTNEPAEPRVDVRRPSRLARPPAANA